MQIRRVRDATGVEGFVTIGSGRGLASGVPMPHNDSQGFLWPDVVYILKRPDGGVAFTSVSILGEQEPQRYLPLFTDQDLATTFIEGTQGSATPLPMQWFKDIPPLLERVKGAGVERVAIGSNSEARWTRVPISPSR